jgi:hypothetical protein
MSLSSPAYLSKGYEETDVATLRTIFPLGTISLTDLDSCMDNHNYSNISREAIDQHVSDPKSPDFSVVLFRPNFMLASEEHSMKAHKNQCLLNLLSP